MSHRGHVHRFIVVLVVIESVILHVLLLHPVLWYKNQIKWISLLQILILYFRRHLISRWSAHADPVSLCLLLKPLDLLHPKVHLQLQRVLKVMISLHN